MDVTSATANFFCTARYRRSSSDANWRKEHFYKHPKMFFFFYSTGLFQKTTAWKSPVIRCVSVFRHSRNKLFASDRRQDRETATRTGNRKVLFKLQLSVVTKWETAKLAVFKSVFFSILTYCHWFWI